jgi:serine/threonine protein phosphatase 1
LIYAIGDIHGQHTMLKAMLRTLQECGLRDEDTLLFLGDYVDRGEDSRGVVQTLIELQQERDNLVFLRGNHEQLMLDARDGDPPQLSSTGRQVFITDQMQLWFQNGGEETLYSYKDDFEDEDFLRWWEAVSESHWDFIRATQMEYITPRYHFVHAGLLPPGSTREPRPKGFDERLWIREPFLSSRANFDDRIVVFGHTPQRTGRPLIERNKIGLDTGAVFGGPLTAAAFDAGSTARKLPPPRFFSVSYAVDVS